MTPRARQAARLTWRPSDLRVVAPELAARRFDPGQRRDWRGRWAKQGGSRPSGGLPFAEVGAKVTLPDGRQAKIKAVGLSLEDIFLQLTASESEKAQKKVEAKA